MADKKRIIRFIYLYLVTAITIVLILISTIQLLNLALSEFIFDVKGWDEINVSWECEDEQLKYRWEEGKRIEKFPGISEEELENKRQECIEDAEEKAKLSHLNNIKRDLSWTISMLIVALPLYLYHWGIIKKEK